MIGIGAHGVKGSQNRGNVRKVAAATPGEAEGFQLWEGSGSRCVRDGTPKI